MEGFRSWIRMACHAVKRDPLPPSVQSTKRAGRWKPGNGHFSASQSQEWNGYGHIVKCIAAGTVAAAIAASVADAAENGNTQYAPGSPQFFAGQIPPYPGLYFLSQTSYFGSKRSNDRDGNALPIDFETRAIAETMRFLYVSDVEVGEPRSGTVGRAARGSGFDCALCVRQRRRARRRGGRCRSRLAPGPLQHLHLRDRCCYATANTMKTTSQTSV